MVKMDIPILPAGNFSIVLLAGIVVILYFLIGLYVYRLDILENEKVKCVSNCSDMAKHYVIKND